MQNSSINRPKRLLTRRLQSVRAVCWSLDTFGDRLKPGQRDFIAGLRRRLCVARDGLKITERHLGRSERRRGQRLRRRNRAQKKLRASMVAWRGVCAHAFGDAQLADIGFARRVEEAPEALLEQAVNVTSTVADADFVVPSQLVKSLAVDWPGLVVELKALTDVLSAALDAWRDVQCDVTLALHDRNKKLDVFNHDFLHIARIVEALLRRAGLDDLADQVRPSTRRRGVTREPFVAGATAVPVAAAAVSVAALTSGVGGSPPTLPAAAGSNILQGTAQSRAAVRSISGISEAAGGDRPGLGATEHGVPNPNGVLYQSPG